MRNMVVAIIAGASLAVAVDAGRAAERYAIIDTAGGVVTNVILNEGQPTGLPDGVIAVQDDQAGPGYLYADGAFEPPEPVTPVAPNVVSRLQAMVALQRAGLLDQVQAWVDGQNAETKLIWNNAIEFRRDSTMLNAAASALNLSSGQLDQLFIDAAQIIP